MKNFQIKNKINIMDKKHVDLNSNYLSEYLTNTLTHLDDIEVTNAKLDKVVSGYEDGEYLEYVQVTFKALRPGYIRKKSYTICIPWCTEWEDYSIEGAYVLTRRGWCVLMSKTELY